jgi:hypothetical protein
MSEALYFDMVGKQQKEAETLRLYRLTKKRAAEARDEMELSLEIYSEAVRNADEARRLWQEAIDVDS